MGIFKRLFSLLGALSPVHIGWVTLWSGGKKVGTDQFGNKYYCAKPRKGYKRERRWVIYNGTPESTMIPPEWHGWIHHQSNEIPTEKKTSRRQPWQKPYTPNASGTDQAYRPPGHLLSQNKRQKASGDYESWDPSA